MQVTTLLSDIAGVLLQHDPTWQEDATWEAQFGLPRGSLLHTLFEPERDAAALRGQLSQQDLFEQTSVLLGLESEQLAAFEPAFWLQYQLNEELAAFVCRLRARYRVVLLSNAWSGARTAFNRLFALDTLADFQIFSAEEGFAKPDARLYLLALERLHIQPAEALFLDDRLENIQAAHLLGFRTLLFQDNAQAIPALQQVLTP